MDAVCLGVSTNAGAYFHSAAIISPQTPPGPGPELRQEKVDIIGRMMRQQNASQVFIAQHYN